MNLLQIIFLALLGLSAGMVVAGGVFSFIVELGVISDFADRTHTGNHILIYEDMVAAGAILGNLFQIFEVNLPGKMIFLAIYGLFGGIFVGCWAMALAEILNVFPIFMRRVRIVRYLAVFVVMVALGKGIGAGGIVFLEKMVNSTASFLSASAPAPFFLSLTPAPETFPFSFLSQPASFLQNISDK